MLNTEQDTFNSFMQDIISLPVWIKQIIYLELKEQLENTSMKNCIEMAKKENCLQLYIPKLTYIGKNEFSNKTKELSDEVCKFLISVSQEITLMEIAIKNNWNLSECSRYFLESIEQDLVTKPFSNFIKGTALYMSGRIRLGEFFVKINKITIDQLDEALRKQKELEEAYGDRPGLAEILVNMNFITKQDTEGILLLKEDCQKYYKRKSEQ